MEWLELRAIKSGLREKDDTWIEREYAAVIEEAGSREREQQIPESWERYGAAWRGFSGLRDVSVLETKVKQLDQSSEVLRSRSLEKDVEIRQKNTDEELSRLLDDVIIGRDRAFAMQKLQSRFAGLRSDGHQKKDEAVRLIAVRVLTRFWIMLNEETALAFEPREYGPAALKLEVMAQIRPDDPQIYYHLARAYTLGGRKKEAITALRNAVAKGYMDIATLESTPDLARLSQF
jgi:tetratricopeptide (TPR) repeat protein